MHYYGIVGNMTLSNNKNKSDIIPVNKLFDTMTEARYEQNNFYNMIYSKTITYNHDDMLRIKRFTYHGGDNISKWLYGVYGEFLIFEDDKYCSFYDSFVVKSMLFDTIEKLSNIKMKI